MFKLFNISRIIAVIFVFAQPLFDNSTIQQINLSMKQRAMKQRVLVGMSGGTDSSVAAIFFLEQGYEVVGITFRFWEEGGNMHLKDAVMLAVQLGIEHIAYDAREFF